jgi:NAD(P)H-dependent FMN reductase
MSKNILVVTGSVRKGRVADSILELVKKEVEGRDDVTLTVADVKALDLPFFDDENFPASPSFNPTNEKVVAWTKLVEAADGVILLTPEYNHSLSSVQKNAIDWIYSQWQDKPVSIIGYGWSGASLAISDLTKVLGNVKAKQLPKATNLFFMKNINPDGTVIDEAGVADSIKQTIDELEAEF